MDKLEKVIKGLECCAVGAECDHCPYSTMNKTGYEGCYQMHADALALLKAQEPIYDAYMRGATLRELGDKYGVARETIRQIVIAEKRRLERD